MDEKFENVQTENVTTADQAIKNEAPQMRFADRVKEKQSTMKPGFVKGMYVFFTFIAVWFLDFIDTFKRNPSKIGAYLIALPGIFIGFLMNLEIDTVYPLDVKVAPVCMFILVICGCINIFEASGVIKYRNLKTIIIAGVLSLVIFAAGLVYIIEVIQKSDDINRELNTTNIESFITVGISMVCGIIGTIIAFIFRDKNYKKDKF